MGYGTVPPSDTMRRPFVRRLSSGTEFAEIGTLEIMRSSEFVLVFKAIVGSGLFALPYGVMRFGLVGGVGTILLVYFLSLFTTRILVKSAKTLIEGNFKIDDEVMVGIPELAAASFGRNLMIIPAALVGSQFIAVCVYVVFLVNTLAPMVEYLFGSGHSNGFRSLVLIGVLMLQVAFAMAPDPSFLNRTASFGNVAFFFSIAFILGFEFPDFESNIRLFNSVKGGFICFGITCFTLASQAQTLAIFSAAPAQMKANFEAVVNIAMGSATSLYLIIAIYAYGCFGDSTAQIIFDNYERSWVHSSLLVLVALMLSCNYPLTLFPLHQMLETIFHLRDSTFARRITAGQAFSRIIVISSTGLVAFGAGKDFGSISVIGGAFTALVAFVLPPLFDFKLHEKSSFSKFDVLMRVVVVLVGLIGGTQSLLKGMEELLDQ